jgi:8-oxo-dGTP diphosphatase
MLNIKPPDYKYCPFCGQNLVVRIEEGKRFKHCGKDNWTYYPAVSQASSAIILDDNKILLVQRNREPFKSKWMLPSGFLDYGEHPQENIVREVKEETGLSVKNAVLFDILQAADDPRAPGNMVFYYKILAKGKISNNDKNENLSVKWFDINNLPPIAWKDHKTILDRLKREVGVHK